MRLKTRILFMLVLELGTSSGRAAEIVRPERFRRATAMTTLAKLTDVESVFSRADELLNLNTPEALARAEALLELPLAEKVSTRAAPALAARVRELSNRLLARVPESSSARPSLVATIDAFDLWSPAHAWFLIDQARTATGVTAYFETLTAFAREFSERDLDELELALRGVTGSEKLISSLMTLLDLVDEADVERLFARAATEYAETLDQARRDPTQHTFANHYAEWMSLDNQRFSAALAHLRRRLADDEAVARAFRRARNAAGASPILAAERVRFFDDVTEDYFDWLNREAWTPTAAAPAPRTRSVGGAQIIRGHFGRSRGCADLMDEEG